MFHEIHFEIKVPITYKGDSYPGTIAGNSYIDEYVYGADRDGNRGETRYSMDTYHLTEVVIDMGEEDRFILSDSIENKNEVETYIFEDAMAKIKG